MTHELVKIKVIVLTAGMAVLVAGMIFLVTSAKSFAAPLNCAIDPKPGEQDCEAVKAETTGAVEELKRAKALDSIFANEGEFHDQGIENAKDLVTLAPLPPAAMLFGGAIVGLIYLGRRRKVKAVQED